MLQTGIKGKKEITVTLDKTAKGYGKRYDGCVCYSGYDCADGKYSF